jgi:hypothetical protein
MGCKCMHPMDRRVRCYQLRKCPLRKCPLHKSPLRKCPLRDYKVLKYLFRSIVAPPAQKRWCFYDESQVLAWYGSDERRLSLAKVDESHHTAWHEQNWACWMNVFKSIVWHWEPGRQVSSFSYLGDNPSYLDVCLAHVGYFLGNPTKVGSKGWRPFPENTVPSQIPMQILDRSGGSR